MNINYILCPVCGKKLCRVVDDSVVINVYIWCKNCKKEILVNRAVSHKQD